MGKTWKAALEERVKAQLSASMNNIETYVDGIVRDNIKAITMNAMGFRPDSWNKWEFAVHDRGNYPLLELFKKLALESLERHWAPLVANLDQSFPTKADLEKARNEFKHAYASEFRDLLTKRLREEATRRAQTDVDKAFEELVEKYMDSDVKLVQAEEDKKKKKAAPSLYAGSVEDEENDYDM